MKKNGEWIPLQVEEVVDNLDISVGMPDGASVEVSATLEWTLFEVKEYLQIMGHHVEGAKFVVNGRKVSKP